MSGIYIHAPFCAGKCSYCDFYSLVPSGDIIKEYTDKLCALILRGDISLMADTIYFGGGTPTLLGEENLHSILQTVIKRHNFTNCEVTLEANPNSVNLSMLKSLYQSGFNRISFGIQSMDSSELTLLGRTHSNKEVYDAFNYAVMAGFTNISGDIIMGVPNQTMEMVESTINQLSDLNPTHISAYILKIEESTPFSKRYTAEDIDEDLQADIYLNACSLLEKKGFMQYEISNFSKAGYESKHNLKYWELKDYLGIGPSAHSYINGKRFYMDRDLKGFINANSLEELFIADGTGGDFNEYIMLGLRLNKGLDLLSLEKSFPQQFKAMWKKAEPLIKHNIIQYKENRLFLDKNSFLISNTVINSLL